MKVTGSTIQQLDRTRTNGKPLPRAECRNWRLWATTEHGRKSRRFHGTYTQACDALQAFVDGLSGQVPNAETFGAYAESWRLWREKSGDVSPNTIAKDARNVVALRRTALDTARMDAISPADIRDALLWLKENPARGKTLSGTTMRSIYVALNTIMQRAVDDGVISANPCEKVNPPRTDTREKDALSPQELSALLDALDTLPCDAHVCAIYLMACLGLRRGEALALLDADIKGGMAHVHLAVKEANGAVDVPKSGAGVRTLPMPKRLIRKVNEWRELRPDAPTLCCAANGAVMRPQNLYKWWVAHRAELGCDGVTLHQLRHSNLSIMARHMSPFDLQRWAGWSSIEPAKVYIHADSDALVRAVLASEI